MMFCERVDFNVANSVSYTSWVLGISLLIKKIPFPYEYLWSVPSGNESTLQIGEYLKTNLPNLCSQVEKLVQNLLGSTLDFYEILF